ncbi:hypothetical protein DFQ27_002973 [Actinomortierella ambigua]|uniref:Uncharacterized protein n=1 Tax=Actinomortierella ambigua TaxID=1343610 RepID=A0A9P6Q7X0_9FUNG|nr:hypothetical protein DFQ27_002973 [Actinomortierella ambigua]
MSIHPTLLKIFNVLSLMAVTSTAAIFGRDVFKAYSHPHLLQVDIWGYGAPILVTLLVVGFPIAQWFDSAHDVIVEAVSWHFAVSNLVVSFWIFCWYQGWMVLSEVAIVLNFILVWRVYTKMRVFTATNLLTYASIHVAFSVYSSVAWIDIFQNFFAAFTDETSSNPFIVALALGSLLTLTGLGWYQAELSRDPDSWSAATIIFSIYAIVYYQSEQEDPARSIIVLGLIALGFLFNSFARRGIRNIEIIRGRDDIISNDERRGLLG